VSLTTPGDWVTFRGVSTGTQEVLRWDNTWGGKDYDGYIFSESSGGYNLGLALKVQAPAFSDPGIGLHNTITGTSAYSTFNLTTKQIVDYKRTTPTTIGAQSVYSNLRREVAKLRASDSTAAQFTDGEVLHRQAWGGYNGGMATIVTSSIVAGENWSATNNGVDVVLSTVASGTGEVLTERARVKDDGAVSVSKALQLGKITALPTSPQSGYMVNHNDTLKFYNGATWKVITY